MNRITVISPSNIEIEYRLAGPGSRAAAAVLDLLLQSAAFALYALPFILLSGGYGGPSGLNVLGWRAGALLAGLFVIFFGYYVTAETFMNGRTFGKHMFGLRVLRVNGMPVAIIHSLIRNIFKLTVDMPGVGLLLIMFTKKHVRVGDIAASTIVVAEPPVNAPPPRVYTAAQRGLEEGSSPDAPRLNEKETALLKKYFARKDTLADGGESVRKAFARRISERGGAPETAVTDEYLAGLLSERPYIIPRSSIT